MEFKGKFERALIAEKGTYEITFSTHKANVVDELKKLKDKDLDIKVQKHREARSLDANAYFWRLADDLASALSLSKQRPITKEEIYRQYIHDVGAFVTVPVAECAVARWAEIWTQKGLGWIVEDLGECAKTKGYHNMQCYYGSSVYDKRQMSRLIDLLVADCEEAGVETKTPDEIRNLKSLWGQ